MHGRKRFPLALAVLSAGLIGILGLAAANKDSRASKAGPAPFSPATDKIDSVALAKSIDRQIDQRLQADQVKPSGRSDDAEFLRRLSLDLTGHIPPADKVGAFLDSKDADKRVKLIDELLASSDYGKHQADVWQALLVKRSSDNRALQTQPLITWLEDNFNQNKPWDKFVSELITATGTQDKNGAVTYFLGNNTVDKMNDSAAKLFLGVQLQCAQCHNHPFTDWKQTEYWHMAAFFMKVQVQRVLPANRQTSPPGVSETAAVRRGRNALPESAKVLPPKFLQGEQPAVKSDEPLRPVLAAWLTSQTNPYFARAMVNRTWAQLFGRGLVNPVDDMHDGNPASHPELLNELAGQFAANQFDLKYLIRSICLSESYQRSSKPNDSNAEASPALFSRMAVKVLTPEQLFDSLVQVVGQPNRPIQGDRPAAGRLPNANPRTAFVNFFGIEDGSDPTEYQAGIPQVLRLMNSPMMNNGAKLAKIMESSQAPAEIIEKLYLNTVSRRPTAKEMDRLQAYLQKSETPRKAYADILWALLNSSEFTCNH
jgi:Protein of unknown function (DUF1553)/Protein of unknown function (DUF1549)